MRRRRGDDRNSYARRPRNFPLMGWVRTQPCRVSELDPSHRCEGPVQADHIGEIGTRGGGRKCSDDETIPLCMSAHADRGARSGFFAGWSTERLRSWADAETARYRETYEARRRGLEGLL
jgi:hypothetical protein